jgi:hypothetical protein
VTIAPPIRAGELRWNAESITMAQLHRDNRYDRMTDCFQQLVGRAPISAAEFARRHAAAFTPG